MQQRELEHLADDPGFEVLVATGTEHWRRGEITLRIHGTGAVEVEHRRAGEYTCYSSTLDHDRLRRLGEELSALNFTELASKRTTYRLDEPTICLEFRRGNELLHRAELPAGERETDERLDRLVRLYESLVDEITGGKLPRGSAAAPR